VAYFTDGILAIYKSGGFQGKVIGGDFGGGYVKI
jgi:hypothetical protein